MTLPRGPLLQSWRRGDRVSAPSAVVVTTERRPLRHPWLAVRPGGHGRHSSSCSGLVPSARRRLLIYVGGTMILVVFFFRRHAHRLRAVREH